MLDQPASTQLPFHLSLPAARWIVILTLCAIQFVDVLSTTVTIVALPAIAADLSLDASTREQVVGIYALWFGALLLLAGRLADIWGGTRLFVAGLVAFGVGSLVGSFADSSLVLLTGRGVQGIGAALAVPAALSRIAAMVPAGPPRDRVIGFWAASGAAGGAGGFVLGGIIADWLGWRWTMLFGVPPVLVALVIIGLLGGAVLVTERRAVTVPLRQSMLLTGGLLLVIFGLGNAQSHGLAMTAVVTPLLAGLVLLGLFARGERGPQPLVPRSVWRNQALNLAATVSFLLTFTTTASAVLLTLFLQGNLGFSGTMTGLILVPFNVAVVVGSPIGARLTAHGDRDAWRPMALGLLGIAVALVIHALALGTGHVGLIAFGLALSGFSLALASVGSTALGLAAIVPDDHGSAAGVLNAGARVGTALGIAAFSAVALLATRFVADGSGAESDVESTVVGYQVAHLFGAALILLLLAGKWRRR